MLPYRIAAVLGFFCFLNLLQEPVERERRLQLAECENVNKSIHSIHYNTMCLYIYLCVLYIIIIITIAAATDLLLSEVDEKSIRY